MSRKRTNVLTYEEAHEWFFYDPDTGLLHWKMRPNRNSRATWGAIAGSKDSRGYWEIRLKGVLYRVHNIVWVMNHGDILDDRTVDHKDLNKSNNRIENLRLANKRQQGINQPKNGFCWNKNMRKWHARH